MENEKVIELDRNNQNIAEDDIIEFESTTKNLKEMFSCHFYLDEVNYPFSATTYGGIQYKSKIIGKISERHSLWCTAVFYDTLKEIAYEIKDLALTIDGHRFSSLARGSPLFHWTVDKDIEFVSDRNKQYDVITKSIESDLFRVGNWISYKVKGKMMGSTHNGESFDMQSTYTSVKLDRVRVFVSGKDLFVEIESDWVGQTTGPSSQLKFFAKLK